MEDKKTSSWECHKCGSVYSFLKTECGTCKNSNYVIVDSTSITNDPRSINKTKERITAWKK